MSKVLVIPDFGEFEISKEGDVWRTCNGDHKYKLTPFISKRGYYNFLIRIGNRRKHLYLHRLLAMAFIPNPNNLLYIRHLDGDKLNNSLNNLKWEPIKKICLIKTNMEHTIKENGVEILN